MLEFWKNGNSNGTKEAVAGNGKVQEQLKRWLAEEGFTIEKRLDDNSSFRYWVTRTGSPKFSVFQPRNKSDIILIESAVTFDGHEELFSTIADQTRSLSWELQSHLLSKGFYYKIQPPEPQFNKPAAIFFAKPIYYDGLSKDRFIEATHQAMNTVVFVILAVQRQVAQPATNPNGKCGNIPYLS